MRYRPNHYSIMMPWPCPCQDVLITFPRSPCPILRTAQQGQCARTPRHMSSGAPNPLLSHVSRGAYDPRDFRTWPSYSAAGDCVCSAPDAVGGFTLVPSGRIPCPSVFFQLKEVKANGPIQVGAIRETQAAGRVYCSVYR